VGFVSEMMHLVSPGTDELIEFANRELGQTIPRITVDPSLRVLSLSKGVVEAYRFGGLPSGLGLSTDALIWANPLGGTKGLYVRRGGTWVPVALDP
jgi:hypothetical protein